MPAAYSYLRFSDPKQGLGRSEDRQASAAETWCRANGYTLDKSLRLNDRGRSGFKAEHLKKKARLTAFLSLIDSTNVIQPGSVLVIEHIDRISRLPWQRGLELVQRILSADVHIVTLIDNQRYTQERLAKDMGCIFGLLVYLCQAHEQSSTKSARLSDVWASRRKKMRETGRRQTRRCPSWIDKDTGEVIAEKADTIRRVFAMALAGAGPNKIARALNVDGVKPIGFGKSWSHQLVRHYLTSRTVIGEQQPCKVVEGVEVPDGEPVPGVYLAIIDPETWLGVQRSLSTRSARKVKGRIGDHDNLFTGLVVHAEHGGKYHLKTNTKKDGTKTYMQKRLVSFARINAVSPDDVAVDYDVLESIFFRWVREVNPLTLFRRDDQVDKGKQLESAESDLIDLDLKIKDTRDEIRRPGQHRALIGLLRELDADRDTLVKRIEILKSEVITSESRLFDDLRSALSDQTAREKLAALIRLLVDRIEVLPKLVRVGRHRRPVYTLDVWVVMNNGGWTQIRRDERGTETGFAPLEERPTPPPRWPDAGPGSFVGFGPVEQRPTGSD